MMPPEHPLGVAAAFILLLAIIAFSLVPPRIR